VAPAARAPARYGGPAEQHKGGEGSPGRWRNGEVVVVRDAQRRSCSTGEGGG
jgi:hypothetical protein